MKLRVILPVQALLVVGLLSVGLHVQNVGIGTATPDLSARLHISDNARGLLILNVALSATNVAAPVTSPATSLLVYNTNTAGAGATALATGFYYWDGIKWVRLMDMSKDGPPGFSLAMLARTQLLTSLGQRMPSRWSSAPTTLNSPSWDPTAFVITTRDNSLANTIPLSIDASRISLWGKVGIGTTTPGYKLEVQPSNYQALKLSTSHSNSDVWLQDAPTGIGLLRFEVSGGANAIGFNVAGAEKVRFDNTGNVGIGTTNPQAKLHVENGEFWLFNNGNNTRLVIGVNPTSGQFGCSGFRIWICSELITLVHLVMD